MNAMKWSFGDVNVTLIRESTTEMPLEVMYLNGDPAALAAHQDWLSPFMSAGGSLGMSVHTLVVESQDKVMVVDTCVGPRDITTPGYESMPVKSSTYLEDLAAAGFDAETVDLVLFTHLHVDHVGWNTRLVDGQWVPTFPNARYLFSRIEYEHWKSGAEGAAFTFDSAVVPVYEAGLADLVETDHRIDDAVSYVPTPGHSPGHVSVRIASRGEEAVITGDVVHHPVQFAQPGWHMFLDGDPELAVNTRREFIDRYAGSGARVFGTHFTGSSSGFLEGSGDSVRFGER